MARKKEKCLTAAKGVQRITMPGGRGAAGGEECLRGYSSFGPMRPPWVLRWSAALGTSTITSYVESATGISQGARTGLASVVTAVPMLLALFLSPLVKMISSGYDLGGVTIYPAIGPALVVVGVLIMSSALKIAWRDFVEALPAFLTIAVISYTMQITEGIAFGFISYSFLKLATGRGRKVHWLLHLLSVLFILRFIFLQG